jgi:hypothetical protein
MYYIIIINKNEDYLFNDTFIMKTKTKILLNKVSMIT